MRKIILLMHVSLDGFVTEPNGEIDWIIHTEEEQNYVTDLLNTVDTVLFGRVTYQMMESFWPTVPVHPVWSKSKYHAEHAVWIEKTEKIVFSKTLEKVDWNNSRLVKEHIPEEIEKMKQQPGKNIVVIASPSIAQTFMQLCLIDEYRINVNPIVVGGGKPLFKNIKDRIDLKLVETKTFSSGVVGLVYGVKRGEGY
ncbi:dihydrofolate reductase family protein [Paenibacillus terrigena]|uniref:dihydrofolate reductase family protein n=1 Tax=Paenibacillus terrigena TaxID=369333 RepID=UPI00036B9FAB|nr:dihydrofolate reductase family protein [Paenibacillus terrigena]